MAIRKNLYLSIHTDPSAKGIILYSQKKLSNSIQIEAYFQSENPENNQNQLLLFLNQLLNFYFIQIDAGNPEIIHNIQKNFPDIAINKNYKKSELLLEKIFIDLENREEYKPHTLCFPLIRNSEQIEILLGRKKRGFGKDFYNGFGGKKEENETFEDCVKRELKEETNLECEELILRGKLFFSFDDPEIPFIKGWVYEIQKFKGFLKETEEMFPHWFIIPARVDLSNINIFNRSLPFESMWEDDSFWFPYFINQNFFYAKFHLDKENHIKKIIMCIKGKK